MDQKSNLIQQIFQILSQLEQNYQKYQRIDENLRNKLYEKLKTLPNYDEIIEEFERLFSLSYDENDINPEDGQEISRNSINSDQKSSQKTKKSSMEVQENLSESQQNGALEATKSKAAVKVVTPVKRPTSPRNEKERKQTCVELFADFGSFFNQSLSVGFKYCTETEVVRRRDEKHE